MNPTTWHYYNHALLPNCAPHETVVFESGKFDVSFSCRGGVPLMARWTSDFDCKRKTSWWYEILDQPFDMASLKAKRRYVVRKGMSNFGVRTVNPREYSDEIADVAVAAVATYEGVSRADDLDAWKRKAEGWTGTVFGAFPKDGGPMAAWALVNDHGSYADFTSMKADPAQERLEVNAALVKGVVDHYAERLEGDFYICDGERSVLHQTAFQDYLEKYFGFRKAYCTLNLRFRFPVNVIVACLRPFRKCIKRQGSALQRQVWGVLQMDSIARGCAAQ